ncbi:alpha/beta hydrolase domain-containing protein [Prescottella subtropica]|uniref:alpha/beta hydrolase domain-containing protein n=1 Tax=Prescottella subtropica TaxID=2545757 RepID=UPI0010F6BCC1|nr:alpha/beta hydrolase domain-containing protein [Prescottella subtropica]
MFLHARRFDTDNPSTTGIHGTPATATSVDLTAAGYLEQEFFLSGTATAYREDGEWGPDGRWSATEAGQAPYRTRLLVRRPADPERFNGTVVVEWLNISGGVDVDVDFGYMHSELLQGYAWVGVSAQAAGVNSTGGSPLGPNAVGHKAWNPLRYGPLHHPGDAYSYDIFSQAGTALRAPRGADPLAGLDVEYLLATGQSQSAMRMLTYANAIQPLDEVFDGIVIHSRAGFGAPLGSGTGVPMLDGPDGPAVVSPARIRTDLDVPVFQIVTETELFELGGTPERSFVAARQPDTELLRTWEIAGAAHSDAHALRILYPQYTAQFGTIRDLSAVIPIVNDGQQAQVVSAALRALRAWVADGVAPATADPIESVDGTIVRDRFGNAVGGVRTPAVDAPTATLTGETVQVPHNGATVRLDADTLAALYPSPDDYVTAVTAAADRAVAAGFLRFEDGRALVAASRTSHI